MADIYLFSGEPNPIDIRLRDPTSVAINGNAVANVQSLTVTYLIGSYIGDAGVSAFVQSTSSSVQASTVIGSATIEMAAIRPAFAIQSPTLAASANTSVASQSLVASVAAPAVAGESSQDATVTANAITLTLIAKSTIATGDTPPIIESYLGGGGVYYYAAPPKPRSVDMNEEELFVCGAL